MMSEVGARPDDAIDTFRLVCRDAIGRVYSFALARCGNVVVAQEVTSETLLAGAQAATKGQHVSLAWLLGVARHKLVDHWRAAEREERRLRLAYEQPDTVEELMSWERDDWRDRALSVLSELAPAYQAVLGLRYLDGRPVDEIANELGRSVHATESLLARARRDFRAKFQEHTGD
jgi:RNA polymerase sigma-70 factor (ECF subfamily)